jgi:hypothetical protein
LGTGRSPALAKGKGLEGGLAILPNSVAATDGDCYNEGVATPEELAGWYASAWNERDSTKRREFLESACSPGIRFLQQGLEHEVVGIDALHATIAEFQASWPEGVDVRVELTTPVDSHHGFGRGGFVWIFGEDRGYGTDFAELGDDGKMKTIVVFGDPGPPPTAVT